MAERYCSNCGHELAPDGRFCPNCGRPAHETAEVRTPEADVSVPPPPREASAGRAVPNSPQAEAPGERRTSLGKFVIIALVVILVLVILGNLTGGGEEAASGGGGGDAARPTPPAEPSEEAPDSGETFVRDNYAELVSDPDAHEGAAVDVTGQLLERPEVVDGELAFQMYADPENLEWNTIVYTEDTSDALQELNSDDYVRVKGEVLGEFEGENAFGASLTVPAIQASDVQTVSAGQAVDPAQKVMQVNRTAGDQGFSVTLQKLEFGEESTRAYVTMNNGTGRGASFYTFDAKIRQGAQQIDYLEDSYAYYEEEPQSDLGPGVQTEGVLAFGPVDPNQPFELIIPWTSNNYNINSRPVVFEISP